MMFALEDCDALLIRDHVGRRRISRLTPGTWHALSSRQNNRKSWRKVTLCSYSLVLRRYSDGRCSGLGGRKSLRTLSHTER